MTENLRFSLTVKNVTVAVAGSWNLTDTILPKDELRRAIALEASMEWFKPVTIKECGKADGTGASSSKMLGTIELQAAKGTARALRSQASLIPTWMCWGACARRGERVASPRVVGNKVSSGGEFCEVFSSEKKFIDTVFFKK